MMIALLVRHHPLFRTLPKLLGGVTALSSVAINIVTFHSLKGGEKIVSFDLETLLWFQFLVFFGAAGGLLWRGACIRSEKWYLGLPLSAEKLWQGHYLALLIGFLTLLAMQVLVAGGFIQLLSALVGHPVMEWGDLAILFVRPALVLIVLTGLVATYDPSLMDISQSPSWRRGRLILLGATSAILLVLSFLPPAVGLIPAAITAMIATRSRRNLPPGLMLGGFGDAAETVSKPGEWEAMTGIAVKYRGKSPLVSLSIINQLFKIPYQYTFLMGLFLGFFGLILAGVNPVGQGVMREYLRLNNIFITLYLLFTLTGEFVQRLHKVDALPVSRVKLLRYLMLPGLMAMLLSYGGGRLWIELAQLPEEKIHFQDSYGKFGAAVSPGFHDLKQRGYEEKVQAPWGESHLAVARHPVPIHPSILGAHTQYLTEGTTSREFLAWQLSRATEYIYGVHIEPDEIDQRYIQNNDEGDFHIPRKGFTVARDYGLKPRSGGPVGALILGPLLACWFWITGIYFRQLSTSRTITWSRNIWWVFMGTLFVCHILLVLGKFPFWEGYGGAVLVFSTARRLGEMGWPGYALAYGLGLVLVWLGWQYCQRMFRLVEAPRG